MTIVAKGAALFASTKDAIIGGVGDEEVALDVNYESATIEPDTLINVKINKEKTKVTLPEKVILNIERGDKGFNVQQEINTNKVALIELQLNVGVNNVFNFSLVDDKGNNLICVPSSISFLPIDIPPATNNYFMGIEIWDKKREIGVFKGLRGLEKNKPLKNAVGVISDIKTPKQLVPGKSEDTLEIRIFQGEDNAEGKDSFLSDHVMSVIITGDDVENVIPAQSDIEVTLKFFEEGGAKPTCSVFFPDINWTHKIELPDFKRSEVDAKKVGQEIDKDITRVTDFLEENNSTELEKCLSRLRELKLDLKNNENNPSGRITVLNKVRENRREIENHILTDEWPKVSEELKSAFFKAEELVEKIDSDELEAENLNMDKVHAHLEEFRGKVDNIVRLKDTNIAKEITSDINQFIMGLLDVIFPGMRERKFIEYIDEEFADITWLNPTRARQLINMAINNINNKGFLEELERICKQISDLIDRTVGQPPIPIP
jgi:molecular chaperone DnaK